MEAVVAVEDTKLKENEKDPEKPPKEDPPIGKKETPKIYPESVYRVSAFINEARRSSNPRIEVNIIEKYGERPMEKEREGEGNVLLRKEPANMDTSPPSSSSSDASSPVETPESPSVSCGHHSCGSLFARCAEHGRSQLLQTFTDPESLLSRQTFPRTSFQKRSNSHHSVFRSPDHDFALKNRYRDCYKPQRFSVQRRKNSSKFEIKEEAEIVGNSNERSSEPKSSKVFSKYFRILNSKIDSSSSESLIESIHPFFVKRHVSLPGDGASVRISGDFYSDKIIKYPVLKKNESSDKGRSSSESKILREAKKILKFNGRKQDFDPSTNNKSIENKTGKNDDRLPVSYLILKSSPEAEELEEDSETDRENEVLSDAGQGLDSMGNGAVCRQNVSGYEDRVPNYTRNSKSLDKTSGSRVPQKNGVEQLLNLNARLRKEAKDYEHKLDYLETEVLLLRREIKKRDQENLKLQREVHKLRSVLQQTSLFKQEGDLLSSLQESHGMPGQVQQVVTTPNPNKKQGVSGESSDHGKNLDQIEIERFEKDFRSKQLIKDAILENDFLKNLDTSQVREIVESVFSKEYKKGSYVLREGEAGSHLYVSADGELEVIKDNKILGRMGPGKAFGELAILYNCRRTASIKVAKDAKVWVLDRRVFQQIMMKTGLQRLQENISFLRSVPLLHQLSNEVLAKIADALEVDFYPAGAHIIRQGASGDTFFIISAGMVKVTQQVPGRQEEEEIRTLGKGDYFGEQALLKEDCRTASVIALSPGVECLTLDRDSFIQLIGDLSELQEKDYKDQERSLSRPSSAVSLSAKEEYDYIRLDDLEVVTTLGLGGFGRVELVQYSRNENLTFALKCLRKQHIVDTQQQEHVYSEKNIMMACNSPFICRLYRTFRDSKYVYMLMEACLGGEVWTILRDRGCFDDYTTKFVTGCVLEAFEYLHARGIIYRDLKPENLLLDNFGYVKIVDFGFSKRLGFSSKTWTFCGTPEYVAPEIILNKGHDRAVDYWSLGVLMHELLTGTPPFTAPDPMRTYNMILKGIDMIDFPKHMTKAAVSLIKKLCRDSPSERLGYQRGGIQDIKKHKWFEGFDWNGLRRRVLAAPIISLVRGPTDATNFDFYSKETDSPPDEFSNWDADF